MFLLIEKIHLLKIDANGSVHCQINVQKHLDYEAKDTNSFY